MENVSHERSYPFLLAFLLSSTNLLIPPVLTRFSTATEAGDDHRSTDSKRDKLPTEGLVARSPTEPEHCQDAYGIHVPCSFFTSTEQIGKVTNIDHSSQHKIDG